MSIDQRTILELILGLYRIQQKYGPIQTNAVLMQKKRKHIQRQVDEYEEFYDLSENSDLQYSSPKLSRLSNDSGNESDKSDNSELNISNYDLFETQRVQPTQTIDQCRKPSIKEQSITDKQNQDFRNSSNYDFEQSSVYTNHNSKRSTTAYSSSKTTIKQSESEQQKNDQYNTDSLRQFLNTIDKQQIFDQMIESSIYQSLQNSRGHPHSMVKIRINNSDIMAPMLVSNIGILQSRILNCCSKRPQLVNIDQNQIIRILTDYVISAYSYDFSVIRLQQSNILTQIYFIAQQFIDYYDLSKEDDEIMEQMIHTIQQIEKRNQDIRAKTIFCCQKIMVSHSEKFLICNKCGKLCNYQKKSVRKDRNEGQQRNTSYHSIRHFDDVFKQLFIQPVEPIDSVTKLQLQEFMVRDHKQKVSIEDVRQYLKQLPSGKGSKLNKSDAFIMGILNGESLSISNVEYQFIKNTFQQFIQILYKNAETRKNTPNCVSFIRKIIDLLYKDVDPVRHQTIVKRLHQQKENTTRKMQKIWQHLINEFDVNQLKTEFKETIRNLPKNQCIS